jgi:hypothetical protein
MKAPEVEVRNEGGYFSVFVNGQRLVDRESYQIAENVAHALRNPEEWQRTESHEVAGQILRWLAEQEGGEK